MVAQGCLLTEPIDLDTGRVDRGAADTGAADTGTTDTGTTDTGTIDTGSADTGPTDTGPTDTGATDTGATDTSVTDTGSVDTRGCPTGFARIAPGTFIMGSPTAEEDRNSDETQHTVTITRAYCMKATEVTQGEWQAEMGDNPSSFQGCGPNCPVERVSWDDAVLYANALSRREGLAECYTGSTFAGLGCAGYRLPTEAEWEYAARAGMTGPSYGLLESVGWHSDNSGATTHAVGGKTANSFGLYDVLGNVWEWTNDWYDTYPATVSDPTGPTTGSGRVSRGGSWNNDARIARAAFRSFYGPDFRSSVLGFRLSRTAP
jgi:formylglycine-generating enzyme required for sulfatase activity